MNCIKPAHLVINNQFNTQQAISYQKEWASLVQTEDSKEQVKTVAGLDIAYDIESNQAFAIAIVLDAQTLTMG